MVDRIPIPSTTSISRVTNSIQQTQPQTNDPTSPNNNATNVRSVVSILQQLPPNQSLSAQVNSSQVLSTSEQVLLQRVNPSLAQQLSRSTQASSIATGSATNRLNQTTQAPLYLTKLTINTTNTTANIEALPNSKTLITISTQAFSTDQLLTLGQQYGQLVLSPTPSTQLKLQEQLQQAASQAIKNILPKQENLSQLQQFTAQLSQTLKQLPTSLQTKLVKPQTLQAITQLGQFTQTSTSLAGGAQVQQALNNSGITFEAKLALIHNLGAQSFNRVDVQQDIRVVVDKLFTSINSPISSNTASNLLSPADLQEIISTMVNTQNTNSFTLTTHVDPGKPLTAATAALFSLLGIQLSADTQSLAQLPKIIEQHLKKLAEQTQAKIELNQLRSLSLDQPNNDKRTNLQQFQTELPLRFSEQVLALHINIHEQAMAEEHYQDKNSTNEKEQNDKKARRWQVLLSFDLPKNEKLHSQLTIVESSISATLWAESSTLCQQAQSDISWLRDKLLANGLTVEDITCLQGKPQQKESSLGYNLVDIKT